jgi:Fic/DOC family
MLSRRTSVTATPSRVVLQRSILKLPLGILQDSEQLHRLDQARLDLASTATAALLDQLRCPAGSHRMELADLPSYWRPLWHEFSECAMKNSAHTQFRSDRTAEEIQVTTKVQQLLADALICDEASQFVAAVELVGKWIDFGGRGFKRVQSSLKPDTRNVVVRFPCAESVEPQLRHLHWFIRNYGSQQPVFVSLVAMTVLVNCHPFFDGNGRASRVLFNALLRNAGLLGGGCFPLYEFFWRCGCGWEIRLRHTEFTNDWRPLCNFICDVLRIGRLLAPLQIRATKAA